jgi:hypothetical protein
MHVPRPSRLLRRWGGNRQGLSVTPAVWVRLYSAETAETGKVHVLYGTHQLVAALPPLHRISRTEARLKPYFSPNNVSE